MSYNCGKYSLLRFKGPSKQPKVAKVDSGSYCNCQERGLANKTPKYQNSCDRIYGKLYIY